MKKVDMMVDDYQLPGFPQIVEKCWRCGELVFDNRHVVRNGQILCRVCAGDLRYYYELTGETNGDCKEEHGPH